MMPAISALDGRVRCRWCYRSNDYSVPVAYGHREVLIRGYVDEVVISCGAEVIARHRRSYDSEDLIFDPLHYLPLIEQKIGALDQAAPLAGWDLPEAFILCGGSSKLVWARQASASTSRCSVYWRPSGSRRSRVRSATSAARRNRL